MHGGRRVKDGLIMENLLNKLQKAQNERSVHEILKSFSEKNKSNFTIDGNVQLKTDIVKYIYHNFSLSNWELKTQAASLSVIRILARGKEEGFINSEESLRTLASIACNERVLCAPHNEGTDVVIEAVKCLCNVLLNHKNSVSVYGKDLQLLDMIAKRLKYYSEIPLSYELVYFDLRLLFILTACDDNLRRIFRDQFIGLSILTNVIERTLFPHTSKAMPTSNITNFPMSMVTLPCPVSENDINLLCESLKIIYNQTYQWTENEQLDEEILRTMDRLSHFLRLVIVSVPAQHNSQTLGLLINVIEVLVNLPQSCVASLLMSCDVRVMPFLVQHYHKLYPKKIDKMEDIREGGVDSGIGVVYGANIDRVFSRCNMAAVLAVLNVLHIQLCNKATSGHTVSTIFLALRSISKKNRTIRKFLRQEILPPLGTITKRPDEGDFLKNKIIRLMSAANPYGAEEMTAEFLFVLCKENANRLVKHTGYGRAAGLLMAHGLMSGGASPQQSAYSSDDEISDTEEYEKSLPEVDIMTGGPRIVEESPLDSMTDEDKEREAIKLHGLIQKLNEKGIIKMAQIDGSDLAPKDNDKDDDDDSIQK